MDISRSSLTQRSDVARDFDLGITVPPLAISMDFIAGGLVQMIGGLASAAVLAAYAWWARLVLAGAWLATHWLLPESAIWRDRNTEQVRSAQRDAVRLSVAVDPAPAKESAVRLARLDHERFGSRRTRCTLSSTKRRGCARSRSASSLLLVLAPTSWSLALAAAVVGGDLTLGQMVVFAQAAVGASAIGLAALNWALDAARSGAAGCCACPRWPPPRVGVGQPPADESARARGALAGRRLSRIRRPAGAADSISRSPPVPRSRSRTERPGKTTLAKLLCRLYDPPRPARSRSTASTSAISRSNPGASASPPCFRTSSGSSCRSRDQRRSVFGVRRRGARGAVRRERAVGDLDTILRAVRGRHGPVRRAVGSAFALARRSPRCGSAPAWCSSTSRPPQLDVRGEAEIFDRILAATRHATTILISHRFSTVRHADRICVLERGRVIELGTHDELIARGGRYQQMFDLQAQRFTATTDEVGAPYEAL